MSEKTEDLKPCPFCGAHAIDIGIYPETDESPRGYFCKCAQCCAETSLSSDRYKALAAWNTRFPLTAEAEVLSLQRALEPFAEFAADNTDDNGWTGSCQRERIVDWFGPSDFRAARSALLDGVETKDP